MGVRGLTSFIAKNAEQYLRPFELHDCDLVIDGDNLACNLFKDVSNCNSAFGGDYDEYYRTVVNFFHLLEQCNVRAFVIMDGGYEQKKMRTVEKRLRGKISIIKNIDPINSKRMFPIMMREIFVNAVRDSGVYIMRCIFEADDELAALAKKLNCPVLSYDSDFYIHNVKYIPSITLTMRVLEKKETKIDQRNELRLCEVRHIKKRKQMNKGEVISTTETFRNRKSNIKMVKYLDCCMYKTENLIEKGSLSKDKMSIFVALLGNDYIESKVFKKFHSQVGIKGMNKKIPHIQKRIISMLRWLKHETKESALNRILGCLPAENREFVFSKMQKATEGYNNQISVAFDFFRLDENDFVQNLTDDNEDEEDGTDDDDKDQVEDHGNESDENCSEYTEEEEEHSENDASEAVSENDSNHDEINTLNDDQNPQNNNCQQETINNIPEWLRQRIYLAELPRFFSDLLNLRLYINSPQIENFLYPDCNEISIPILLRIFSLLQYPNNPDLRYLTRVTRLTNVTYKKLPSIQLNKPFDHEKVDIEQLKEIFTSLPVDTVKLFQNLEKLPANLRLYFLSIIYWSHRSPNANMFHIQSILMCLVILQSVDSKVEPIRDHKKFRKIFGKLIQKEKLTREKIANLPEDSKEKLKLNEKKILLDKLTTAKKIKYLPRMECILVQENALKYFHYDRSCRKRHLEYTSTIIHGFSEFQAVIFQMLSLNALVNYPLETIRIQQLYNGIFLYNMYSSLTQRPDVLHYIQFSFLKDSKIMYEYFYELFEWCKEFVPFAKKDTKCGRKSMKKKNALKKKQSSEMVGSKKLNSQQPEDKNDMLEKEEDDEYYDINNRFYAMLQIK